MPAPATAVEYDAGRLLETFRGQSGVRPTRFQNAAGSRDELVRRFADALARADTSALRRLTLTRGEFAWLYYEESPQSKPPYELDPALMWEQIQARSRRGLTRSLRDYGRRFAYRRYACVGVPERLGAVTLQPACVVTHLDRDRLISEPLFGSIIERDGLFKFVGLSNRL